MAKKKRKLSAYNRFIRAQVKAGRSFAQAARSWKGGRTLKTRKRVFKRKAKPMARRRARRYYARARRRSAPRRNPLMNGIFPVRGLLAKALIGAGAALIVGRFAPKVVPYQDLLVGGAVGGLPGAAGVFALQTFGAGTNGVIPGGMY